MMRKEEGHEMRAFDKWRLSMFCDNDDNDKWGLSMFSTQTKAELEQGRVADTDRVTSSSTQSQFRVFVSE